MAQSHSLQHRNVSSSEKCLNPFPSLSHHLVARVYESKAEFRSALQHEKEGYTIYKNQVMSGFTHGALGCCHCRARTEQLHCKPVPSLGLGEAFPTNSSGQMPGSPCRARAKLLPCAVTAHCYARSLCSASCKCVRALPVAGQALLSWHSPMFWWGLEKAGPFFPCFAPLVFKY